MNTNSAANFNNKAGPGRPPGLRNKITLQVKEKFDQLLSVYTVEQMKEDLLGLKPEERLKIVIALSEFVVPKLARIEVKAEVEKRTIQVIEIDGEKIPI